MVRDSPLEEPFGRNPEYIEKGRPLFLKKLLLAFRFAIQLWTGRKNYVSSAV